MAKKIDVTLNGSNAIGSVAVVTKYRIFCKPVVKEYVCQGTTPILGGVWFDKKTGYVADADLMMDINEAAQAAVRLATFNTFRENNGTATQN